MEQEVLTNVQKEMGILSEKVDNLDKKIDAHNEKHEADMARLMPIIEAYEFSERRVEDAKATGRFVLYITGAITAIGGAWLILKQIWPWL